MRLGLADRIEWRGARSQPEVLSAYRAADLFVLAAKIGKDGDRDGLPNVLVEAQSQGLACIATRLPGIAELVVDGRTGMLAPSDDPAALAAALDGLIRNPARRRRLGDAGAVRARREFDIRNARTHDHQRPSDETISHEKDCHSFGTGGPVCCSTGLCRQDMH